MFYVRSKNYWLYYDSGSLNPNLSIFENSGWFSGIVMNILLIARHSITMAVEFHCIKSSVIYMGGVFDGDDSECHRAGDQDANLWMHSTYPP